jgi:hypothetical protein
MGKTVQIEIVMSSHASTVKSQSVLGSGATFSQIGYVLFNRNTQVCK